MDSTPRLSVGEPTWSSDGFRAPVWVDGVEHSVDYLAKDTVGEGADSLLTSTLLPAMATKSDLRIPAPVSPRLLAATDRIQDIFISWGPSFSEACHPVHVTAEPQAVRPSGGGVACFFSGGVDSFYTLLSHQDEIDALIFMHGFDIPLADTRLREQARATAMRVADSLSLDLHEVETNVRDFADDIVDWGAFHGGALAASALLFQHRFSRVLIPSSFTYTQLFPWGSHPLVDPLWSTERTELVYTGAEADRPAKVAVIAESDLAMRYLRVCWKNPDSAYNCGGCEKCIRTVINLAAAGAHGKCETLPQDVDLEAVASLNLTKVNDMAFARENRIALEARGGHDDLVDALRRAEAAATEDAAAARALHAAEERAGRAEHALAQFQQTRRYRMAQSLGRPLDSARAMAGRVRRQDGV